MEIASSALSTLALLAMGHFVGDFVLQNDRMAVENAREPMPLFLGTGG